MGSTARGDSDLATLTALLDLLAERSLSAAEVQVGQLRVALTPQRLPSPPSESGGGAHLSEAERVARRQRAFEATMYASSEGGDLIEVPLD